MMIKKLIASILTLVIALPLGIVSFTAEESPAFVISDGYVQPGGEVEVSVSCVGNPGITAWKVDVSYDQEVMELTGCDSKGVFDNVMTSPATSSFPYTLSWSNDLEDVSVNGKMATLKFKVKDNAAYGDYNITLDYDEDNVYSIKTDENGIEKNIHFNKNDGTIHVVETSVETDTDGTDSSIDTEDDTDEIDTSSDMTSDIDTTEPTFIVGSAKGKSGDEITVPVICRNNPGITAWLVEITYDNSAIELVDCNATGGFGKIMTSSKLTDVPYVLSWNNDLEDVTSNGTMAELKFHIRDNAASESYNISLSYDPENIYSVELDESGIEKNIHFDVVNGAITVNNGANNDTESDSEISPTSPKFKVGSNTGVCGSEVEIPITCENNPGITAWMVSINYDTSALELVDVNPEGDFGKAMTSTKMDTVPYIISWSNDLEDVTTNGIMSVLKFRIKENAVSGEYKISLTYDPENVYSVDIDESGMEKNVHFDVVNGLVTVLDNANTDATFIVGSASGECGKEIDIPITCENNPGITAWMVSINYDTTALELVDVNPEGDFGKVMTSTTMDTVPYIISWSNDLEDVTTNGTMSVLKFRIKENAMPGEYKISLSYDPENVYSVKLDDAGMETNVPFGIVNGTVTVTEAADKGIYGDVDRDGIITSGDALAILRTSASLSTFTPEEEVIGDVDLDGIITSGDALAVLRYSASLSSNDIIGTPIV